MPGGVVKPGEEKMWERAKRIAAKELGVHDGDRFWGLVNHIFQNMKHSGEAVRRGLAAGFKPAGRRARR